MNLYEYRMKFELNKELISQIQDWIETKNQEALFSLSAELHWADIAEILDELSYEDAKYFFELLDEDIAADILKELEEDVRERLLSELSTKEIAEHIDNLDSDDAADVIAHLSEEKKEEVLSQIEDIDQASDIVDLLSYGEDTAGGLMAKELIHVYKNWSLLRCVREMRKQAEDVEHVYTIYVVDENEVLCGTISLKRLLLSSERTLVSQIYNEQVISVKASASKEEVAISMQKYDLVALPVVDELNRLIGRVTIDDAVDVLTEEAEKDYQMASGISENIESSDSVGLLTRARLPWLLIGLLGGIMGAQIMGYFDIEKNAQLALFAPLIAAMGGNVGVQSSAIIVQGLASNTLGHITLSKRLTKEFLVALINGGFCSTIIFIVSYFMKENLAFAETISIALLCVIVFAAIFGTLIPLTLNKYKIDPALATGPFITTANDVFGLCIYFYIAQWLLLT